MSTTTAIDALMRHAIDYAGVFPPAQLSVADALTEYTRVRDGRHGWVLGAFVVGSERLGEVRSTTIPLSVVMRDAAPETLADVRRAGQRLTIAALEYPPLSARDVSTVATAAASSSMRLFFEVPPAQDPEAALDAIAAAGAFPKIRTGGVTSSAFPEATAIARFFRACVARRLACKATAGLHHACGGSYALTYAPGSATSQMYGFLNVLGAAALIDIGAPEDDAVLLLTEPARDAIKINADALSWRSYRVGVPHLLAVRRALFLSFGSCSAQEPVDELVRMHLL